MQNILITGANRGIGLALVEEYLAQGGSRVYATCRNPEDAEVLRALADANSENLRQFCNWTSTTRLPSAAR